MLVTNRFQAYRGLFTDVKVCTNNVRQIIYKAELDWHGEKQPLFTSPNPPKERSDYGYYAIVRSTPDSETGRTVYLDGGKPVSKNFKLIDNTEVLTDMCNFASELGLTITKVGVIDNGRLIIADASSPNLKDLAGGNAKKGDLVELGVIMTASYQSGIQSNWRGNAMRLVCLNGMCNRYARGGYKLSHRGKYDRYSVKSIFHQLQDDLDILLRKVSSFSDVKVSKAIQTAVLMELSQKELFDEVVATTTYTGFELSVRGYFLDALQSSEEVVTELLRAAKEKGTRTLHKLLEVNNTQPGLEYVTGTLAQPYHAVTNWVDHHRGGQNDSAVEAALFGTGARLKDSALSLITEYQNVLV